MLTVVLLCIIVQKRVKSSSDLKVQILSIFRKKKQTKEVAGIAVFYGSGFKQLFTVLNSRTAIFFLIPFFL